VQCQHESFTDVVLYMLAFCCNIKLSTGTCSLSERILKVELAVKSQLLHAVIQRQLVKVIGTASQRAIVVKVS